MDGRQPVMNAKATSVHWYRAACRLVLIHINVGDDEECSKAQVLVDPNHGEHMERARVFTVERRAQRMHEMLAQLDVDSSVLTRLNGGKAYSQARPRCLFCGTSDKCFRWLDQAADPVKNRPAFCLNLALFQACNRANDEQSEKTG
jgi:hypothetical protein